MTSPWISLLSIDASGSVRARVGFCWAVFDRAELILTCFACLPFVVANRTPISLGTRWLSRHFGRLSVDQLIISGKVLLSSAGPSVGPFRHLSPFLRRCSWRTTIARLSINRHWDNLIWSGSLCHGPVVLTTAGASFGPLVYVIIIINSPLNRNAP
jgi:hypothetical protein